MWIMVYDHRESVKHMHTKGSFNDQVGIRQEQIEWAFVWYLLFLVKDCGRNSRLTTSAKLVTSHKNLAVKTLIYGLWAPCTDWKFHFYFPTHSVLSGWLGRLRWAAGAHVNCYLQVNNWTSGFLEPFLGESLTLWIQGNHVEMPYTLHSFNHFIYNLVVLANILMISLLT